MRGLGIALLVLLGLAPAADAKRVAVAGGTTVRITTCTEPRTARLLDPGAAARVRGRRLTLDKCVDGRWVRRAALGRRATVARRVGDFRVRGAGRRPAFLRFGVGEIVDVPFAVTVNNVNRTAVPCTPDGEERTLRGHLVGPRTALDEGAPAATLLVHGFGYTEFFWRFRAVPGYDTTAKLATAGHVTVTVDRAGYGASQIPADGTTTCIGSQADMMGQVITALRSGEYELDGTAPVRFRRTALVGHSAGGLISEITAGTFEGVDGLGIISYADQAQTPLALSQLGMQSLTCAGGARYAPLGATDADFQAAHLNAPTDPAVVAAVLADNVPEPCGDPLSAVGALTAAQAIVPQITGPVLLLSGEDDALFMSQGVALQRPKLRMADTVTLDVLPDTGHALVLGESAPMAVNALETWLSANEF